MKNVKFMALRNAGRTNKKGGAKPPFLETIAFPTLLLR
jgi:hypothetical protein